ncbi:hypothetical protein H0H92_014554 [Tricholoma furcatifolium]|nr:hypothetical protein H0H92_014554 [Tricholoma furcatifolium]
MPIARRRKTYTAEAAQKASRATDKKDPKAPKRALSAYMFFSQVWIKAENNDAGFGEVCKLLGARWKELDDKKRKVLSTTYNRLSLFAHYNLLLFTGLITDLLYSASNSPIYRSQPRTKARADEEKAA